MVFGVDDIIALIILVTFTWFCLLYEKKIYKINFTPFSAIALPIVGVIVLAEIIAPIFDFSFITSTAIYINLIALGFFYLGGQLILNIFSLKNTKETCHFKINHIKFFKLFFLFILIIALFELKNTLGNRSLLQIEDSEYAQGGIQAHLGNFITIILISLFVNIKINILHINKLHTIIIIIICLLLKIASSIKAEFLLPIICSVSILCFIGKLKINLRTIVYFSLIGMTLFIGMASFFNIQNSTDTTLYGIYYFFFYLTCGETGFSEFLTQNPGLNHENINFITVFFDNVIATLFGGNIHTYTDFSITDWTKVSNYFCIYTFHTNVYSLIGETFINCGWIIGCLFFLILGMWTYYIFTIAKQDIFLTVLYSYIYGCLFLSFFSSSYILLPSFIYSQMICVVLYIINISKYNGKNKYISKRV